MERQRKNHSAAGTVLLVGAAVVAFSGSQPWAKGSIGPVWGNYAGLRLREALGFDRLLFPGPDQADVRWVIFGGAAVMGVCAILLFLTHVRGVGLAWRLIALATTAVCGLLAVVAWNAVNDPASLVTDGDSENTLGSLLDLAERFGAVEASPAVGLWLLTAGSGISAVAALIPASREPASFSRRDTPFAAGYRNEVPAGWYVDPEQPHLLRYFNGLAWTQHTQQRP